MTFEEKTIKSELIYRGPIFTLRKDTVTTVNGKEAFRDIVEHKGGVGILAITRDKKIILIRQFRKAAEQVMWEIPAGLVEADETGNTAAGAVRELKEETGYDCENVRFLSSFYGSCGYCTEKIDLYRMDATLKGETHFDESEAIDCYETDIKKAVEMVYSGEIIDAKTIVAILMAAREYGL